MSLYRRDIVELVEKVNTATPLGAWAKYAGTSFSTEGYAKLVGFAIAGQDGRLEIQQSQSDFIEDVISGYDLSIAMQAIDFCWVYNAGTITWVNDTTDINSSTANDVQATPIATVEDAIYFGGYVKFNKLSINVGTVGDYDATVLWEYWDGTTWVNLATAHNLVDGTTAFKTTGTNSVTWDLPTDMVECAVNGTTMYWIRARCSVFTSIVTIPLITQAWQFPLVEIPFSIDVVGKYARLNYYNKGTAQIYFRAVCNLKR